MNDTIPCHGCKKDIPLDKKGLPSVPVSVRQRRDGKHLVFCSSLCEATDWTGGKLRLEQTLRGAWS